MVMAPSVCVLTIVCPWTQVCEKALADYMESKRRIFPRFYFVSTADLLDILSNGNNPAKVRSACIGDDRGRQTTGGYIHFGASALLPMLLMSDMPYCPQPSALFGLACAVP
jgi:hypothetical protein